LFLLQGLACYSGKGRVDALRNVAGQNAKLARHFFHGKNVFPAASRADAKNRGLLVRGAYCLEHAVAFLLPFCLSSQNFTNIHRYEMAGMGQTQGFKLGAGQFAGAAHGKKNTVFKLRARGLDAYGGKLCRERAGIKGNQGIGRTGKGLSDGGDVFIRHGIADHGATATGACVLNGFAYGGRPGEDPVKRDKSAGNGALLCNDFKHRGIVDWGCRVLGNGRAFQRYAVHDLVSTHAYAARCRVGRHKHGQRLLVRVGVVHSLDGGFHLCPHIAAQCGIHPL